MIFKLTSKNCQILPRTQIYISQHFKKFSRFLPNIQEDLIVFRLNLRQNTNRYYPKIMPHQHKRYTDAKPALAHFEGSMMFRLVKNQLYVHFRGQTIEECVDRGFALIFKKLEKFKTLHFTENSEYPNRDSIRRATAYI